MEDLLSNFTEKELMMYRIAMTNAKDAEKVDQEFYYQFVKNKDMWINKRNPPSKFDSLTSQNYLG